MEMRLLTTEGERHVFAQRLADARARHGASFRDIGRSQARNMVRLGAADNPAANGLGLGDGTPDQLLGGFPVETHPALRCVHGLGDPQPVAPDVASEGEGSLPIDRGRCVRARVGERVRDHMDGGVREARARGDTALGVEELPGRRVVVDAALGVGQADLLRHPGRP